MLFVIFTLGDCDKKKNSLYFVVVSIENIVTSCAHKVALMVHSHAVECAR